MNKLTDASRTRDFDLLPRTTHARQTLRPEQPQKRSAHRYKVFERAFWETPNITEMMNILDISLTGARAHALRPPELGTRVTITCGVCLGLARISWTDGKLFGAQFVKPLTMSEIDRLIGARQRLRDQLKS